MNKRSLAPNARRIGMELIILVSGAFLGAYIFKTWTSTPTVKKAIAVITPTQGNTITGVATFTQEHNGVRVTINVRDIPAGLHGLHIHEFGNCACDDAACAGEHYNPTNMKHGDRHASQRHVGDFGNIEATTDNAAQLEFVDNGITLNGPHSIVGRSIIVHAHPDDFISQPSGNAGPRIGCGVIGIAKN